MKQDTIDRITDSQVITIVRARESADVISLLHAIADGGLPVIEVTTNTPDYVEIIREISVTRPDILIGAGTITTELQAELAIAAGAQYLVTPITDDAIIALAHRHDIPVVMGAFSPTEIHKAAAKGADFIKLFPADHLGPAYMKAVMATLPSDIRMIPTGGVGLDNLSLWIAAGAVGVGVGSAIINAKCIAAKDYEGITTLAREFKNRIQTIKKEL